jgi:hypothetical protein
MVRINDDYVAITVSSSYKAPPMMVTTPLRVLSLTHSSSKIQIN